MYERAYQEGSLHAFEPMILIAHGAVRCALPATAPYENGRRRNPTAVSCVVEHRGIEPLTS